MTEVTYNVFLVSGSSGELEVLLTDESVETVEGAVRIGNISFPSEEDPEGFSDNHALYQHISQMLYHVNREGESSFWPDNITDLSRLSIEYYEPESTPDPNPEPDPEVPGGDGGSGEG